MRDDKHYTGFVRTYNGDYAVQISDNSARCGYYLITRDGGKYDGGLGSSARWWAPIREEEVPPADMEALVWAFDSYEAPKNYQPRDVVAVRDIVAWVEAKRKLQLSDGYQAALKGLMEHIGVEKRIEEAQSAPRPQKERKTEGQRTDR